MNNKINLVLTQTGLTLLAKIWDNDTQIGDDIELTENTNRLGHYYGVLPTVPNGNYCMIIETNVGVIVGSANIETYNSLFTDGMRLIRGPEIAQDGTYETITLNANASSVDHIYDGARIILTGGTGAEQSRIIKGYNSSTKRCSFYTNWLITPDNTTEYVIV